MFHFRILGAEIFADLKITPRAGTAEKRKAKRV